MWYIYYNLSSLLSKLRISTIVDGRDGLAVLEEPHIFTACKDDSHLDLHLDLLDQGHFIFLGAKQRWICRLCCLNYWGLIYLGNLVLVSRVLTVPSRQFYWRYKRPAASRIGGGRHERRLRRPRREQFEIPLSWDMKGTYIRFGFVNWKKYNQMSMLEKTAAKNTLQRKAYLKTNDQDWNPYISSRQLEGPRNWPIFIVPPSSH